MKREEREKEEEEMDVMKRTNNGFHKTTEEPPASAPHSAVSTAFAILRSSACCEGSDRVAVATPFAAPAGGRLTP